MYNKTKFQRHNLNEFYDSSGIVRYFLPDLPAWANFSQTAGCSRDAQIHFFNLDKIMKSFSLSYEQAVQFQYMFNHEYEKKTRTHKLDYLYFKDEEKLFYTIHDKVQAGFMEFKKPKFKRVHVIWLDPFLKKMEGPNQLRQLLQTTFMQKGHPVLISLCLNGRQMNDYLVRQKLTTENLRLIPFEMFTVFNKQGEKQTSFFLDLGEFFNKSQSVYLIMPKGEKPTEFRGNYKYYYY